LHLLRAAELNGSQSTSMTKVTIGLAHSAPAGVPQIQIALYAQGNDLYLDVQRLDLSISTPPPQPKQAPINSATGVGGWLWLIILALVSKLAFSGIRLAALYHDYIAQGGIELTTTWYETYAASMAIIVGYMLALIAVLVLLFRRSRHFVMAYTAIV